MMNDGPLSSSTKQFSKAEKKEKKMEEAQETEASSLGDEVNSHFDNFLGFDSRNHTFM